jgi:hypothetical protein
VPQGKHPLLPDDHPFQSLVDKVKIPPSSYYRPIISGASLQPLEIELLVRENIDDSLLFYHLVPGWIIDRERRGEEEKEEQDRGVNGFTKRFNNLLLFCVYSICGFQKSLPSNTR